MRMVEKLRLSSTLQLISLYFLFYHRPRIFAQLFNKGIMAKAKKTAKAAKKTAKAKSKARKKAAPKAKKVAAKPAPKKAAAKPVAKKAEKKNQAKPAVPLLTNFPALTQRPIAHKPAKSSTPEDKTRYSDEELKEFENLINEKLEKARSEYRILKETLNRNNDEGTDATSGGNTKVLEDGAETAEKENLSQLAARQQKYITNLENALVRIKNGTYGICSVTGKLIPKERLIAVPHTTQSIEAKMMQTE
jgi:RNA polymerase-binding transcription factor DksA